MDMSSPNKSSTPMSMIPYLHFTGGDFLFFKPITPSSKGALAGAAIFLFLLALLERYIVAMRGVMEARWKQAARALATARDVRLKDDSREYQYGIAEQSSLASATRTRLIPPFIVSHDITRGMMHAAQAFVHFALMLAVMTFQAAYIIMIIAGLGIGELVFGRLSVAVVL